MSFRVVCVGQEIEEKEKGGEIVKLGPTTYEHLMSAFIAHVSSGVGGVGGGGLREDKNAEGGEGVLLVC